RALLHGLNRHGYITVPGDEDHRDDSAPHVELLLQLEAAHAGHAHVQYETAWLPRVVGGKELLGSRQWLSCQPRRFHQQPDRVTDGIVVVDDEYQRGAV